MDKHGQPSRGELSIIKYKAGYRAGFRAGAEAMRMDAVNMLARAKQSAAAIGVNLMQAPEPPAIDSATAQGKA